MDAAKTYDRRLLELEGSSARDLLKEQGDQPAEFCKSRITLSKEPLQL